MLNKKDKNDIEKRVDDLRITNDEEYKENVSAIEQDLTEVEQKDRLQQAYNQLYSDKNLQKITELTVAEITKISILQTYATYYGFHELNNLIDNFLRNRVSLKRKGREEHVKIASAEVVREENRIKAYRDMEHLKRRG